MKNILMKNTILAVAPFCALLATTLTVHAADVNGGAHSDVTEGFTYDIKGTETGSWDSNPLRLRRGAQAITGSTTTPELVLQNITPTSMFNLDTTVVENLYNRSDFNSTDAHSKLGLTKENGRWNAGFNGQVDYDTTRTSEVTNFGINIPSIRRTNFIASPQVTFRPNEIDKVSLLVNFQDTTYDNNAYVDYHLYSISPSYYHNLSPTDSVYLTLHAQRYETQVSPSNTVDNYGPSIGWQSVISPELSTQLTAGVEKSNNNSTPTATSQSSNLNYTFKGNLAYKGQQDRSNMALTRAQQPFGNGTETLMTTFHGDESHDINALIAVNASATYQFADYKKIVGVNLDNQLSGSAGLTYHIYDTLDANASYQYTTEKLTNVSGNIIDHAVYVGFTYHPMGGSF